MKKRLVVVSNRLPPLVPAGAAKGQFAVGGLVSGLRPALEASGGGVWVGWTGETVQGRKRLTPRVDRLGSITSVGIGLDATEHDEYYNGFCNGVLWPLLHSFTTRFTYERAQYDRYRLVNERFARAIARELRRGDVVWIHDFHLIPLARFLRALGVEARLAFFLHVPFPAADIFEVLPCASELLEDLSRYDLVGFHTKSYAWNYETSRARILGAASPRQKVGVYPIGIDPAPYLAWASAPHAQRRGKELRQAVQGRKIILGVDRLDYTKGIPERLRAFGALLERHPAWRRAVSFVQISAPSRTRVPAYVEQRREVEELVGNVNGRFGDTDWVPIRYLFQSYDQSELAALYREADVCLVSPLRDGMNLVAKEFVAAQTGDPGVLVLSRFAGAADELREAVLVNPYDLAGTADALATALSMSLEDRTLRQKALLGAVRKHTASAWGQALLGDLARVPRRRPTASSPPPRAPARARRRSGSAGRAPSTWP